MKRKEYEMNNTCRCGCKGIPNFGKQYIHGHHRKGICLTEEHKKKIGIANSKALRGRKIPRYIVEKQIESRKGYIISKETKRKISKANKGQSRSEETKRKLSISHLGLVSFMKGKHHNKRTRKRLSNAGKRNWQNPEYREKQLEAIFAGHDMTPNRPERRLRNGLNKMFPKEYKFVGDGKTFIGGKCPDFININGQKKIIELFGTFWHGKEYTGRTKRQEEEQRINHFAKYGYETLIIWQKELEDIKQLKRKLIKFHRV